MRAQNQPSFADWQNLVQFTQKSLLIKFIFRWLVGVSGNWRRQQSTVVVDSGDGQWQWQ